MFEEKLLEPHFTSVLAPYMLDVVEQKRALGNKYNAGVEALSAFDDFCNEQQLRIPAISKELLQKWEKKRPHENETTQCFRISYVRILCKYLHSNGYDAPCAFHPAPHVNKCFVPYIFTKDEIERLFSAVDCTKESSESPLRHLVMPVLFRLLYTCGLRVSEALHLKVADVDLDAGVLAIHVTEKPLQLMRDVVQICEPGGRILDPFAGAGTTVLAAVQEGYEAVGIEMSDAYFRRSTERLKTALESEVNQN